MRVYPSQQSLLELSGQIRQGYYFSLPPCEGSQWPRLFGGFEWTKADYLINRQSYPCWILEHIVEGTGELELLGKTHPLTAGTCFLYGREMPHRFRSTGAAGLKKYFLALGQPAFPEAWTALQWHPGDCFPVRTYRSLAILWEQLIEEGMRPGHATSDRLMDVLHGALLLKLNSLRATDARQRGLHYLVKAALEIIDRDFATLRTLEELSRKVGVSPEHLCRLFRKDGQDTPYQLLQQRKMEHAAILLQHGPWNVTSAAQAVGYSDPLHFSRVFKKIMGVAPSRM